MAQMNIADRLHELSPSRDARRDPRFRVGQQVAVITGDGQGWMAAICDIGSETQERMYWIGLADGRKLAKRESELAELIGIGDAGWPTARKLGRC